MARPRKNATKMIGVKLSIADFDRAVLAASNAGIPLSRWATSVVSAHLNRPVLATGGWSDVELPTGLTVKIDGKAMQVSDSHTGEILRQLQENNPAVTDVRMHPDGDKVIVTEQVAVTFPASLETVDWKGVAEATADLPAAPPREPEPEPRPITWTEKWNQIRALGPVEGGALFAELRNGRPLPNDFKPWPTDQKLRWLEANWPL